MFLLRYYVQRSERDTSLCSEKLVWIPEVAKKKGGGCFGSKGSFPVSLEQHSALFLAALELEGEMMVNFS